MKQLFFLISISAIACSCNLQSATDNAQADRNEKNIYRLRINPPAGAKYYYNITNETDFTLEVEDKEVENGNKSEVGVLYIINKDSTGNLLLTMDYDKLHIYTKANDIETDYDADKASISLNPTEKILGLLKDAELKAVLTPSGEVKEMIGYKELGDKVIPNFHDDQDGAAKQKAREQWDKMIGEGMIRKNMEQLFQFFPDSAIRVGDKWKNISKEEEGEFGLNSTTTFKLKAINDDIALIQSETEIADSEIEITSGIGTTADVKGSQEGEYEVNTKTGMLMNCRINGKIEGTVTMMGKEVPLTIKTSVKIEGKKVK